MLIDDEGVVEGGRCGVHSAMHVQTGDDVSVSCECFTLSRGSLVEKNAIRHLDLC